MKLQLPNVTLVCATSRDEHLTGMAVRECVRQVDFADVLIWAPRDLQVPGSQSFTAPRFTSVADYDRFMWSEPWRHVKTSHYLVVQWDAWVTNPDMWSDAFLEFDYIGAPWPWYRDGGTVGNFGFSLCSTRLFRFLSEHEDEFPFECPLDVTICREYRPRLQRCFSWAPDRIATRFSFETWPLFSLMPKTFGFHGFRNWPFVLSGAELDNRLRCCEESALSAEQLEWFHTNRDHVHQLRRIWNAA